MGEGRDDQALRALSETIKEQARASQDQILVLGKILQGLENLTASLSELKTLSGMIKDQSSETRTLQQQLAREIEELQRFAAQVRDILPDSDRLRVYVEHCSNAGNTNLTEDQIRACTLGEDNVRRAVTDGVNQSFLSILKSKLFWVTAIILLSGFLFLVGVKALEIGDVIKISGNTESADPK